MTIEQIKSKRDEVFAAMRKDMYAMNTCTSAKEAKKLMKNIQSASGELAVLDKQIQAAA